MSLYSLKDPTDSAIQTLANEIIVTQNGFPAADDIVRAEFASEDTAIRNEFAAADGILRADFESEDLAIRTDFATADDVVRGEFATEDTAIRNEFAAADNVVRNEFTLADVGLTALINSITGGIFIEDSYFKTGGTVSGNIKPVVGVYNGTQFTKNMVTSWTKTVGGVNTIAYPVVSNETTFSLATQSKLMLYGAFSLIAGINGANVELRSVGYGTNTLIKTWVAGGTTYAVSLGTYNGFPVVYWGVGPILNMSCATDSGLTTWVDSIQSITDGVTLMNHPRALGLTDAFFAVSATNQGLGLERRVLFFRITSTTTVVYDSTVVASGLNQNADTPNGQGIDVASGKFAMSVTPTGGSGNIYRVHSNTTPFVYTWSQRQISNVAVRGSMATHGGIIYVAYSLVAATSTIVETVSGTSGTTVYTIPTVSHVNLQFIGSDLYGVYEEGGFWKIYCCPTGVTTILSATSGNTLPIHLKSAVEIPYGLMWSNVNKIVASAYNLVV